ncbi:unnamed protein product [Prorocentrum cordatum]|uniref:Uncharacterized protein n=1 Tax=Prorocentrum cordatum TaxID=2364126 RepID=A0ABN9WXS2_9DINO|nr:unnamed protein product [Polarella glacialis]
MGAAPARRDIRALVDWLAGLSPDLLTDDVLSGGEMGAAALGAPPAPQAPAPREPCAHPAARGYSGAGGASAAVRVVVVSVDFPGEVFCGTVLGGGATPGVPLAASPAGAYQLARGYSGAGGAATPGAASPAPPRGLSSAGGFSSPLAGGSMSQLRQLPPRPQHHPPQFRFY